MLAEDREIYRRFLLNFREIPGEYKYDVLVGHGLTLDPGKYDENILVMTRAITKKRIDVVILTNDIIWIVEIKPNAAMSALGQVLGYVKLYERDHPAETRPLRPMIITDRASLDDKYLFLTYSIRVIIV